MDYVWTVVTQHVDVMRSCANKIQQDAVKVSCSFVRFWTRKEFNFNFNFNNMCPVPCAVV